MKPVSKTRETVKRRPAESASAGAAALVSIGMWAFGLEPPPAVVAAMVLVVGAIPAGVSKLVDHRRK